MSLESIIKHILDKADADRGKIILQANEEAHEIVRLAKQEAERLYKESIKKEKAIYEKEKQRLIVNARLESKRDLLKAKQDSLDSVFGKLKSGIGKGAIKKELVKQNKVEEVATDIDFYIDKLRAEHEAEIAKMLFG